VIANHDAHAKNYSLLVEGDGAPRLAPLYDLVSTWAYGRPFGRKLAMKYGGEYRLEYLRGRHLDRLAGDLGMSPRAVRDRALQLVDRVTDTLAPTREKLPEPWRSKPILDSIVDLATRNAALLRKAATESI
jgi:serine/threonine-protein kinase HipA